MVTAALCDSTWTLKKHPNNLRVSPMKFLHFLCIKF